jgi:hypothetical protein
MTAWLTQPITPPNQSSGANPATIGQAHQDRVMFGEPDKAAAPAAELTSPAGQKTQLGQ